MSARLSKITDWEERFQEVGYSVKALAASCGVSPQYLLRFIKELIRTLTSADER
jgi:hypothetical protein